MLKEKWRELQTHLKIKMLSNIKKKKKDFFHHSLKNTTTFL